MPIISAELVRSGGMPSAAELEASLLAGQTLLSNTAEHLIEVVTRVEAGQQQAVEQDTKYKAAGHAHQCGDEKRLLDAEQAIVEGPRSEVGPHHVERTMRQVHKAHDAEHQRKAGRHQKQQEAVLNAVEQLNNK